MVFVNVFITENEKTIHGSTSQPRGFFAIHLGCLDSYLCFHTDLLNYAGFYLNSPHPIFHPAGDKKGIEGRINSPAMRESSTGAENESSIGAAHLVPNCSLFNSMV